MRAEIKNWDGTLEHLAASIPPGCSEIVMSKADKARYVVLVNFDPDEHPRCPPLLFRGIEIKTV